MTRWILPFLFTLLVLGVSSANAVSSALECPAFVTQVIEQMDEACIGLERNQACYGHFQVNAVPIEQNMSLAFDSSGDRISMADVRSLEAMGYDSQVEMFGVAIMKLQASLPNTMPGQNVTFIMLGDVEITSAVDSLSDTKPMQVFYLTTGIRAPGCEEAPPNGLLIQTPQGAGQVAFSVNGVDINMGSTVFIDLQNEGGMRIKTLDGSAAVHHNGVTYPVLAGSQAEYVLGPDLQPVQSVPLVTSYADQFAQDVRTLPLDLLDEPIQPHPGLDDATLTAILQEWLLNGSVCGAVEDCSSIIATLGGGKCMFTEAGELTDCRPAYPLWPETAFAPGDFGCEHPGNYCNAPGHQDDELTDEEDSEEDSEDQPGDFGCEHPGNYCNAPGHQDDGDAQPDDHDCEGAGNSCNAPGQNKDKKD